MGTLQPVWKSCVQSWAGYLAQWSPAMAWLLSHTSTLEIILQYSLKDIGCVQLKITKTVIWGENSKYKSKGL